MMLGMLEEKKRALQKYNYLFQETEKGCLKKSRNTSSKKKSGKPFLSMIIDMPISYHKQIT